MQQINVQNGNKGHILLVEYKAFMLNNMIEKHYVRKFLTPKKLTKPVMSINRDKYTNENSSSIKEVDEESEIMNRSKRNFSSVSFR